MLYEELARKDKRERTSQIKALVEDKVAEIGTKFQSQLAEVHSLVMELSADLETKLSTTRKSLADTLLIQNTIAQNLKKVNEESSQVA